MENNSNLDEIPTDFLNRLGRCCGSPHWYQGANEFHRSIGGGSGENQENRNRMHRNSNPKRGADTSPVTSTFTVRFRINGRIIPLRRHRPKHQPALSLFLSFSLFFSLFLSFSLFFFSSFSLLSLFFLSFSLFTHTHTHARTHSHTDLIKTPFSNLQCQQITHQRLLSFHFKFQPQELPIPLPASLIDPIITNLKPKFKNHSQNFFYVESTIFDCKTC